MPAEADVPQPTDSATGERNDAPDAPARPVPHRPPPPRIVLALLGTPGVKMNGRPLTCGSRKALALLAFVALEGRATRARLAALFWPDLDGASARRNLRRELHRLRGAGLNAALEEHGEGLAIAPSVATDVAEFEGALGRGDLALAMATYRGQFLGGLSIDDAGGLEAWAISWRQRLAQRFREAVEAQVSLHEAAGRWREALVCQLRLLEEDVPQEADFRTAMLLHARLGEREAAMHLFERCRRLLGRELGLRPMPQTLALADRIRRGDFDRDTTTAAAGADAAAAPRSTPADTAPSPGGTTLFGREPLLRRVLDAVLAGRAVWLVGEAGAGKSELAQEAAARLGPSWRLQARPGDADQPYASLVRALRAGLPALQAPAMPPWAREALAHLLPELGEAHGRLDVSGDRERLHAALAQALRRLWPRGIAAVVLDDWHLADHASREFWQRRPDDGPWPGRGARSPALIVTARDGDAAAELRHEMMKAHRRGDAELLEVPPLDASATEALLAAVGAAAGWPASPELAQRLHRATSGNPFFILEMLRRGPPPDGGARPDLLLPPSLRDVLLARLSALDDGTRRLLEAASLIGLPFMAEDLAGTTALSDDEILVAIERAQEARVLLRETQGALAFSHDLIAQALAEGLGAERRRLLHRRLARTLERRGGAPARIATHLEQAGDRAQAVPWRLAAAAAAAAVSAHDDALAHLDAALADCAKPRDAIAIQLQRARLLQRASRPAAARAAFDAAEQAAIDAGDGPAALGVALARAEHDVCSNRIDAAMAAVDALLAEGLLSLSQQVEALEIRADALVRQGELPAAQQTLREALTRLPSGPSPLRGRLLTALGRVLIYRGEFAAAVPWLDKAVRVHTALGAQEALARALHMRGAAALNLGEFDAAVLALERARTHAARSGSVPVQRGAILNLVKIHTQRGDVQRAVALLDEGEALSPLYESLEAEGAFLQARYYCHALRGELGRALAMIPAVVAHADRCTELYWQVGARQLVADLLLLLGELERASDLLAEAARLCADDRDGHHWPLVEAKMAWCELLRGEPAAAIARLERLGSVDAMTMPEAADVRRHVEAAARLALGDAMGALALLADPGRSSTEESKALQWAVRLRAEAARGAVAADTRAAVEALLADEARLPALEALALRQALALALRESGDPEAAAQAERAESRRVALLATLGEARPPRGVLAPAG